MTRTFSRQIFLVTAATFLVAALGIDSAFAQDAAAPAASNPMPMPFQFILGSVNFFLIAFFVYYVLVLRPNQLRQENHARFIKALKRDEEVVTSGGVLGRVAALSPEFITVDVGSGVKLRVQHDHVFAPKPAPATPAVVEKEKDKKVK